MAEKSKGKCNSVKGPGRSFRQYKPKIGAGGKMAPKGD